MAKSKLCVKCFRLGHTETHHALPLRFFPGNNITIQLCESCHSAIEDIIPQFPKLQKSEYLEIHQKWLRDIPVLVVIRERRPYGHHVAVHQGMVAQAN